MELLKEIEGNYYENNFKQVNVRKEYANLDKYYTKIEVAKFCVSELSKILRQINKPISTFIEPSAGSGVFIDALKSFNKLCYGFDILPTANNIIKNDFLNEDISNYVTKRSVFIGNPPFGKRGILATQFINKSLEYSDVVAFIVPVQFRKWNTQKHINNNAKLIADIDLEENSFEFLGEDYSVRCCFQVWFTGDTDLTDLRMTEAPSIKHEDFEMYQYNNTFTALKFFDYDFDFAVLRQGWGDYSEHHFNEEELSRSKQWIFFKAKNEKILRQLKRINFEKLANLNTSVRGFGKADVIKEYTSLYNKGEC